MKRICTVLLGLCFFGVGFSFACADASPNGEDTKATESTVQSETDAPDDRLIKIGEISHSPDSLGSVIRMSDYFVICRVESRGESYLYGNEFVPTDDRMSLYRQFQSIRTPYELEILEVLKGDEVGETMTAVASGGELGGYIAETFFDQPTAGKVYVMPIGYLEANDEYAIMRQGLAEVDLGDDGILSDDDRLTPTIFDEIWDGLDDVADLREYVVDELNADADNNSGDKTD